MLLFVPNLPCYRIVPKVGLKITLKSKKQVPNPTMVRFGTCFYYLIANKHSKTEFLNSTLITALLYRHIYESLIPGMNLLQTPYP